MSFGKKNNLLTIILIALIPIAGATGFLITWSVMNESATGTITINVEGSTTVEPIITTSAAQFQKLHPGVRVSVSGTGSGTGIATLINGQADIAMSSRPVKSSENTTAFTNTTKYLYQFTIAKDGLAVIVHASANAFDLTKTEIKMIFNGSYTDWSLVPGGHGLTGTIKVCVRESGSGTRDAFNELVMGDEKQLKPGSAYVGTASPFTTNQQLHDEVAANSAAIGYVGLGYVDSAVDAVNVNGVIPSVETVLNGTYVISRDLYLVTLGKPAADSMIWEFINWHLSPEGQYFVDLKGFIALNPQREDYL